MVSTDGAGGTHDYLTWLSGQRLLYSVGFSLLPYNAERILAQIPARVCGTPNLEGAVTGVAVGVAGSSLARERPRAPALLRLTDVDEMRATAFATKPTRGNERIWELGTAVAPARTASGPARSPA